MSKKRPFVLGLGGTTRDGPSTERVLRVSLAAAEAAGAQTAIFAGSDPGLPMYQPGNPERDAAAERRIGLFRRLDGIISAIGCICCAAGWRAGGLTLIAMRSIAHALRGWPTPFGAIINTSLPLFGESGQLVDESTRMQLALVGRQVAEFAQLRLNSSALSEAG